MTQAMQEEPRWFNKVVWKGVSRGKEQKAGAPATRPIRTRWDIVNKGDAAKPDIRARLVACELNTYTDETGLLYAATPLLEAKRMLLSEYATKKNQKGQPRQISCLVITKAYFHGRPKRDLRVQLPVELGLPACTMGSLQRCMYGTRDAGSIWEETYASALEQIGFKRGRASPSCFKHPTLGMSFVVHGDDFTAIGTKKNLDHYEAELNNKFDLKVRSRLSNEEGTDKEIRLLNKIIRIKEDGAYYEADPRHAELIIQSLGVQGCTPSLTPGVEENHDVIEEAIQDSVVDEGEQPQEAEEVVQQKFPSGTSPGGGLEQSSAQSPTCPVQVRRKPLPSREGRGQYRCTVVGGGRPCPGSDAPCHR